MAFLVDGISNSLINQQNLLRGSVSKLHSRRYEDTPRDHLHDFRINLLRNFLTARADLEISLYDEYLSWSQSYLENIAPEHFDRSIGFHYLSGLIHKPPIVSLEREFAWIAKRIALDANKINAFRVEASQIELLTFWGEFDQTLEHLQTISEEFGQSFWLIQLRIALEQAKAGLEQQKGYTEELRGRYRRGLLSFVAYHTSVRNEERTSWRKYIESVEKTLSHGRYESDIRNYLRYRLTSIWPSTDKEIADVIRLEQSHNIVDLYETFISLLQLIATEVGLSHLRAIARRAVAELSNVCDFRLDKLSLAFGLVDRAAKAVHRNTAPSDALFSMKPQATIRIASDLGRQQSVDPWQVIYVGAACAHLGNGIHSRQRAAFDFRPLIASILRRDKACIPSLNLLEKGVHNISGLPFAAGLRDFCRALRCSSQKIFFNISSTGLNSAYAGFEDLDFFPSPIIDDLCRSGYADDQSPTAYAWRPLIFKSVVTEGLSDICIFAHALRCFRDSDPALAIEVLQAKEKMEGSEPLRFMRSSLSLACYIELGDKSSIIDLIADEVGENEMSPVLLPIEDALGSYSWPDYKSRADTLSAAIALYVLWRVTENDETATMLRFAFSYHLKKSGCGRPSEFADHLDRFERKKLIYYLRNICVPSIMDMSRAFKSSREVIEERQSVFASLKAIDPTHANEYDNEVYSITNQLVIADGLRLVDGSRIHVDTEAISRWARRHLEEDYARCVDLVRAGIGASGNFDENLREVFASLGTGQVFFTPDNPADAILTEMLAQLREEFLSNSNYGLDYFLSKRVRHQSFIGLLRGPLEFESLITTRESEFGPYRRNEFWLEKLVSLSDPERDQVESCLSKFAERFDDLLIGLKDTKFQIKGNDTLQGIFEIPVTRRMLLILRKAIQATVSFDDFLEMAYLLFWTALDPCLTEARRMISEDLKVEVSGMFNKLRFDLRAIAESDPVFPRLSEKISSASSEVQHCLDQAAAWFVRPEGKSVGLSFTLKQSLDIAVESALKSHRAFKPSIKLEVLGDVDLQAPDLLLLNDAIFIALDNVKTHSGIRRDVDVSIRCDIDPCDNMIKLQVRNTIAVSERRGAIEEKLARIRTLIQLGNVGKGARKEGGSGFLKLAASLRHSAYGKLEFGFVGENEFELNVYLMPTRYAITVVEAEGHVHSAG